jgi:hypothetical protein
VRLLSRDGRTVVDVMELRNGSSGLFRVQRDGYWVADCRDISELGEHVDLANPDRGSTGLLQQRSG